jgi:hypothetical protein
MSGNADTRSVQNVLAVPIVGAAPFSNVNMPKRRRFNP